jgi:hypothetical protein
MLVPVGLSFRKYCKHPLASSRAAALVAGGPICYIALASTPFGSAGVHPTAAVVAELVDALA